jgi:5-methylcytosine-specific restriction protein A
MGLADIARAGVLAALAEFDHLGRQSFLDKYHFGRARAYFVKHNGNLYDSKAIAGYAHGEIPGERRWTTDDFTGGEDSVARHLRDRLGFEMEVHRNFWTRGELILACDLVWANGWHELRSEYAQVIELSQLLQRYWIHPVATRSETFRSPGSVSRKTSDIATQHASYSRTPTRGNKLDVEVLADFVNDPQGMHEQALALRAAIEAGSLDIDAADDIADPATGDISAEEGAQQEQTYLRRLRDRAIRDQAVRAYKRRHGRVNCEACGFDFSAVYGPRGEDYIECHHRTPLSQSGPTITTVADFALLCANCHRMIHRSKPWLTVDELTTLLQARRAAC